MTRDKHVIVITDNSNAALRSVGGNHALRGTHLIACAHASAHGLHGVVAILVVGLAKIQEPRAARRERHLAAVGSVVVVPVGGHGAVGNARSQRVVDGIQRRIQSSEPIGKLLVAQVGTPAVGVGAQGTGAHDKCKQSDEKDDGDLHGVVVGGRRRTLVGSRAVWTKMGPRS